MTLKINNNIPALNAHRGLLAADKRVNRILEKISSGLEIVRAGDGPASLVISEQLRSQIAGLKQAIDNTEVGITMVQTTEAALEEVSRLLTDLRRLAVHASNDAVNDKIALAADQQEVTDILDALNRIAKQTSFGSRKLLDGSGGVIGTVIGKDLEFIGGTIKTKSSPADGYDIKIEEIATQSNFTSGSIPDTSVIDAQNPETFTISEGDNTVNYNISYNENADGIISSLNAKMKEAGIDITASKVDEDKILFKHNQYGSGHAFYVSSSAEGFLSENTGELRKIDNGQDIVGSIGDKPATGKGQVLTASEGCDASGLQVKYTGEPEEYNDGGTSVGKIKVKQNSLIFQVGADYGNTALVSLASTFARDLAKNIKNDSNYKSIADIDLTNFQGAQDALKLVVSASNDITAIRGKLGSVQKNSLEATSNYLRNYVENITAAESTIRDADIAEKTASLVKNQIQLQAASSAMVHANNSPKAIVQLLNAIS